MARYVYTSFWGYRESLKERLSELVGGFDKDILKKFFALEPEVGRNWTRTFVGGAVAVFLVLILLYVIARLL